MNLFVHDSVITAQDDYLPLVTSPGWHHGIVMIWLICQQIVQNSTSAGNWTSVKLLWKGPKDGHLASNITFRLKFIMVLYT